MTLPPDDWSDLSRAWTDPVLDEGDQTGGDLIPRLRRRARLARLNFMAEVASAALVIGVVGWTTIFRGLPWPHALAAFAFAGFAVAMTVWSRRGDPGLLTGTPEAVLRSAIGQARLGFRWAVAGVAISVAAMLFLIAVALTGQPGRAPAPLTLGVGAALLSICVVFYLRHARACRRRRTEFTAALTALQAPVDPPSTAGERSL